MKPDSRPVKLYWDICSMAGLLTPYNRNLAARLWVDMPSRTDLLPDNSDEWSLYARCGKLAPVPLNEVAGKLKVLRNENHNLIVQGKTRWGSASDKKQVNPFPYTSMRRHYELLGKMLSEHYVYHYIPTISAIS